MNQATQVNKIWIGIDNGVSGAIAAVADEWEYPKVWKMPTQKMANSDRVDISELKEILLDLMICSNRPVMVVLETPGKFSKGIQAVASMWDCYGAIRGLLVALEIPYALTPPQSWQKVMLPGCPKGDTKPYALTIARQTWPTMEWPMTPKSKKINDGPVDAALIAEWARRQNL